MMEKAIVEATQIPIYRENYEPFSQEMMRKSVLVIGGSNLAALGPLLQYYAVKVSIIVPTQTSPLDIETELENAHRIEATFPEVCSSTGITRDLGGLNSDSVDVLIINTHHAEIRDSFLSQAWRVTKELGKIVVFSDRELPLSYLTGYGLANPTRYVHEGFYVGTLRKCRAQGAQN